MLLPSAIPCDICLQPPSTVAPRILSPLPSTSGSPSTHILSTCRTLQSLLAPSLPSSSGTTQSQPPRLASPINLPPRTTRTSKKPSRSSAYIPLKTPPTNPPSRKRRRSSSDKENGPEPASVPSTPKRQRRHPPSLPLGLSPSDFASLQCSPAPQPKSSRWSQFQYEKQAPEQTAYSPFNIHPNTNFTSPSYNTPLFSLPPHYTSPPTQHEQTPLRNADSDGDYKAAETRDPSSEESALLSLIIAKLRLQQCTWDAFPDALGEERPAEMMKFRRSHPGARGG